MSEILFFANVLHKCEVLFFFFEKHNKNAASQHMRRIKGKLQLTVQELVPILDPF